MTNQKIGIFGSCVTRDIWTILGLPSDDIKLFARTSIPSMVSPPVRDAVVGTLGTDTFAKKCVYADLAKTAISEMEDFAPDVLFVDLIDERFNLMSLGGSVISDGAALYEAGLKDIRPFNLGRSIPRMSTEAEALWGYGLKSFAKRIMNGPLAKATIILHKCYWATEVSDDGRLTRLPERIGLCPGQVASVQEHNALLNHYYDQFETRFPALISVEAPKQVRIADPKHVWGPAPYHFISAYYQAIWDEISHLMLDAPQVCRSFLS